MVVCGKSFFCNLSWYDIFVQYDYARVSGNVLTDFSNTVHVSWRENSGEANHLYPTIRHHIRTRIFMP